MKMHIAKLTIMITAIMCSFLLVIATATAKDKGKGNNDNLGVIYVDSQGLYYDTFKTTDLPPNGKFQQLFPGAPNGPTTQYGPGDSGYVGGRWWIDTNKDGLQDDLDIYFSCPLLGPGRAEP